MILKIKDFIAKIISKIEQLKESYNKGLALPLMRDPLNKRGSLSALFAYVSFWIACWSVIKCIKNEAQEVSTIIAISFWSLATVFHKFKRLDKFKIDLDDKSIELDSDKPQLTSKDTENPNT